MSVVFDLVGWNIRNKLFHPTFLLKSAFEYAFNGLVLPKYIKWISIT